MNSNEIVFVNAIKHGLGQENYITSLIPNHIINWAKSNNLSGEFVEAGIKLIEEHISRCKRIFSKDGLGDDTDRASWYQFLEWLKRMKAGTEKI